MTVILFDDYGSIIEIQLPANDASEVDLSAYEQCEYDQAIANIATRYIDIAQLPNIAFLVRYSFSCNVLEISLVILSPIRSSQF